MLSGAAVNNVQVFAAPTVKEQEMVATQTSKKLENYKNNIGELTALPFQRRMVKISYIQQTYALRKIRELQHFFSEVMRRWTIKRAML